MTRDAERSLNTLGASEICLPRRSRQAASDHFLKSADSLWAVEVPGGNAGTERHQPWTVRPARFASARGSHAAFGILLTEHNQFDTGQPGDRYGVRAQYLTKSGVPSMKLGRHQTDRTVDQIRPIQRVPRRRSSIGCAMSVERVETRTLLGCGQFSMSLCSTRVRAAGRAVPL